MRTTSRSESMHVTSFSGKSCCDALPRTACRPLTGCLRRLVRQEAWAREQAMANNASSDFWAATGLVLRQFDGLVAGYAAKADTEADAVTGKGSEAVPRLTRADLLMVSAVGASLSFSSCKQIEP